MMDTDLVHPNLPRSSVVHKFAVHTDQLSQSDSGHWILVVPPNALHRASAIVNCERCNISL